MNSKIDDSEEREREEHRQSHFFDGFISLSPAIVALNLRK